MSPSVVLFRRTVAKAFRSFTALSASAVFVALSTASFGAALWRGGAASVAGLWAVSAVPFLPVLAAFLTMHLWAQERQSGRIDLLLTAPVREAHFVWGKFLGAWFAAFVALAVYAAVPLALLPYFAASFSPMPQALAFVPAFSGLLLHATLYLAAGVFLSACFRSSATAAAATWLATGLVPWGCWWLVLAFSPDGRARWPDYPLSAHAYDWATGLFSAEGFVFFLVFSVAALFAASKRVALYRYMGSGARRLRLSTWCAVFLAFVFAGLLTACCERAHLVAHLSFFHPRGGHLSARTCQLLSRLDGETRVTCFLSARTPAFLPVRHLLRMLSAQASRNGARLVVDTVDPRWDLAAAARLVREGVAEGSLVFRRGRRREILPIQEADEGTCAAALLRLTLPARRETVYWTMGHGEYALDAYDSLSGMSDFARDLRRDGYALKALDITAAPSLPGDCALLVVAGARTAFSREELQRVEGYLRSGGRLLALVTRDAAAGVGGLLARWGVRAQPFTVVSPRTLNGADLPVTDFADHVITRPLKGVTLLFGETAPIFSVAGARASDHMTFTPLVQTDAQAWGESDTSVRPWTYDAAHEPSGPLVLAAALERGAQAGAHVAFRPMRAVLIGDAAFALNAALASRAHANRDFLLNAVAWLAGLDAATAPATPGDVIVTGLTRPSWLRAALGAVLAWPLAACGVVALLFWRRRHVPARRKGGV